ALGLASAWHQARALARDHSGARILELERPEGLPGGTDLHERRACHQLLVEDADVAPALERPRAAQELRGDVAGQGPGRARDIRCRYASGRWLTSQSIAAVE